MMMGMGRNSTNEYFGAASVYGALSSRSSPANNGARHNLTAYRNEASGSAGSANKAS